MRMRVSARVTSVALVFAKLASRRESRARRPIPLRPEGRSTRPGRGETQMSDQHPAADAGLSDLTVMLAERSLDVTSPERRNDSAYGLPARPCAPSQLTT